MKPSEEKKRLEAILKAIAANKKRTAIQRWIPQIIGIVLFALIAYCYLAARDGNLSVTVAIVICVVAALIDGAMFMLHIVRENGELVAPYIDTDKIQDRIDELST